MDLNTPEKVREHLHAVVNEITGERLSNKRHALWADREFRDRRLEVAVMLLYPRLIAAEQKIEALQEKADKLQRRVDELAGAPDFITEPEIEEEQVPAVVVPQGSTPGAMAKALRDAELARHGPRNLVAELQARAAS